MADCEFECSQVSPYLFVAGHRVAENLELLRAKGIRRIINCSLSATRSYHEHAPGIVYLTLDLHDDKSEDLSWTLCPVIHFIYEGVSKGENTLLHCEKGISRSASFAIAYRMWMYKEKWQVAFDYIKMRRRVVAPNLAFTCNLIEIGEIFAGAASEATLLFRCAFHAEHDVQTAVLKLCRNMQSRRILVPATSLLNPIGMFCIVHHIIARLQVLINAFSSCNRCLCASCGARQRALPFPLLWDQSLRAHYTVCRSSGTADETSFHHCSRCYSSIRQCY
jgi:predicted protein tyrosine phosphatase